MRLLILIFLFTLSTPAHAGQVIPGPVLADVGEVLDGDTIDVSVSPALHKKQVGDAIWVYLTLKKIADRKTFKGETKKSLIAEKLAITKRTVQRHFKVLRDKGYISTRQIKHGFEFEILKPVDLTVHYRIRIVGVNTPETRTKCIPEKTAGLAAKEFLKQQLQGKQVYLMDIQDLKFAGRKGARVYIAGTHIDLTDLIIKAGHGTLYAGGPRSGWCDQ